MELASGIQIYAELLTNIRRVSVGVSLSSRPDSSTRAEISEDGCQLVVYHQTHSKKLDLPTQVMISAENPPLPIPKQEGLEFSWRLPVAPTASELAHLPPQEQTIPWTSLDIAVGSSVACRNCNQEFVRSGTIRAWKDLPSENWAEMMEFWHCHKPHDHDTPDPEALASKGYGANNAISAQAGIGLVDLTSFLFSESDCTGLMVSDR